MHTYRLYGLHIASQWALPGSEAGEPRLAEVEFFSGAASLFAKAAKEATIQPSKAKSFRHARLDNGADYLDWPGLFEFVISASGRQIAGRFLSKASLEAFQTYFLGQVMSFSLLKLGIEPLHSTVVVIDGEAVAFLGDTGYGKSSLAAAFLKAGNQVLTDDLLVVKENGIGLIACPGPHRIKLFPEAAKLFLGKQVVGTSMNPYTRKLVIPLRSSQFSDSAKSLRAIYVLRPPWATSSGDNVRIAKRPQRRAFLDIVSNTFNTVITNATRLRQQFNLASRLAATIPIKSLSYPRDLSRLPKVVETVYADLNR